MPLHYEKPPLVEALCELRFESSEEQKWDSTIFGLLYDRIKEKYPERHERHAIEIPIAGSGPLPLATQSLERMQFVSADRTTIVQVARDLLAVNSLRPHLGWDDLRDRLLDVLERYRELAAPKQLVMVAVRYINRVELPLEGFALERYFKVLPSVPEGVPDQLTTFVVHSEVGYDDPGAIFRFRFGTLASSDQHAGFVLDYEHVAPGSLAPSFENLRAWLDHAHARIEKAFYGSFTAETHTEVFREVRS